MAHRTSPDGLAVGLDPDEHFLDLARQESARLGISAIFRAGTVDNLHAETGYDLVYARFVLSHMPESAEVIGQLVRVAHPGGMIVIEDVDLAGHFCYPPNAAFAGYVALYQTAVRLPRCRSRSRTPPAGDTRRRGGRIRPPRCHPACLPRGRGEADGMGYDGGHPGGGGRGRTRLDRRLSTAISLTNTSAPLAYLAVS